MKKTNRNSGARQPAPPKKKPAPAKRMIATKQDATGPITLAEAKALALTRDPKPGKRRGGETTGATPEALGAERKRLELQRRDEQKRRIHDYLAVMTLMKQRGVEGIAPAVASPPGRGRRSVVRGSGSGPLQIFAEGDSWFDYPVPTFGGGIIPRLEDMLGVPILNLAKAGDEVRYMLGVKERKIIMDQFKKGCPAGGRWDVMLFSGGGNDIVDNPMALWIRDYRRGVAPAALIHQARYGAALELIRAGYEDLITLRNQLSPNTHLVFHAYDFAIPDGRGVCHLGPWMKPTFDLRGFPTIQTAFEVVKAMLEQFAVLMRSLEASHQGVTFLNVQGTLPPQASSWHNELHPSKDGFKAVALKFRRKLKDLFPNRVP